MTIGYIKGMRTIDLAGKAALITGGTRTIGRARQLKTSPTIESTKIAG